MNPIVSLPSARPQPEADIYGVQELALFRSFTRESFRAAFGIDPPAWNPSRRIKTWFDSSIVSVEADDVALYRVVARDAQGKWTLRQLVLPSSEAASVNLPGSISYPPYVPAPTRATRGGAPVNPEYLSLEADVRSLAAAIGGSAIVDEGNSSVFPVIYPADEPRRMWAVMLGDRPWNAGLLTRTKNVKGVGAPGRWDLSSGEPDWIPAPDGPTGEDDTRPPREMPCRELLPNERLEAGPMGLPQVVRTDRKAEIGFTSSDRQMLREIWESVRK